MSKFDSISDVNFTFTIESKYLDRNIEKFYDEYDKSKSDIIYYYNELKLDKIILNLIKKIGKYLNNIINNISSCFNSIFDLILYQFEKNQIEISGNKNENFENITLRYENNEFAMKSQPPILDFILTDIRNDIINKSNFYLIKFGKNIFVKIGDQDFIFEETKENNLIYNNFSKSYKDSNENNIDLDNNNSFVTNTSITNTINNNLETIKNNTIGELNMVNDINIVKRVLINPL